VRQGAGGVQGRGARSSELAWAGWCLRLCVMPAALHCGLRRAGRVLLTVLPHSTICLLLLRP